MPIVPRHRAFAGFVLALVVLVAPVAADACLFFCGARARTRTSAPPAITPAPSAPALKLGHALVSTVTITVAAEHHRARRLASAARELFISGLGLLHGMRLRARTLRPR
jgi:hypothetical protein